jgi:alpha-L-rhamnosidase
VGLARDHPDPVGIVSCAPRAYGGLRRGVDLGEFASFRATPLDLKGEAHEHFLNGINEFVGHGWPYSPPDAPGLGWLFYAAGALDDRNPWWPAMPELSRYLSRLCWLLQQGEPVADVAVYVSNEDLFATLGRAQGGSLDTWREASRRIPSAIPATIRTAGLDYDLIDDQAVVIIPPDRYRVVIIPATTMILDTTAIWMDKMIAAGGSAIKIDSTVEVPGAVSVKTEGLADALAAAATPDLEISPPAPDIGFVHRLWGDAEVYLVANTGRTVRTFSVVPRTSKRNYEQWDAISGRVLRTGAATAGIELALHPYEATVIVLSDELADEVSPNAPNGRRLPLNGSVAGGIRRSAGATSRAAARLGGRARSGALLGGGDVCDQHRSRRH